MLKLLSNEEASATYPPVVLVYGKLGVGKSTLLYTAGEAGWTALVLNAEKRVIKPRVMQRLLGYGWRFADLDEIGDFERLFYNRQLLEPFDAVILDSLSSLVDKSISQNPLDDKRAVYGANLLTTLRALFALKDSGKAVFMTALEKWDRGFGGVGVVPAKVADDRGRVKTKVEEAEPAPEPYRYMPDLPGKLEFKVGGVGCDIVARLVVETGLDGGSYRPVRHLVLQPGGLEYVKTCYRNVNIVKPTMHLLLADYPQKPKERVSYEETLKLIHEDAVSN